MNKPLHGTWVVDEIDDDSLNASRLRIARTRSLSNWVLTSSPTRIAKTTTGTSGRGSMLLVTYAWSPRDRP